LGEAEQTYKNQAEQNVDASFFQFLLVWFPMMQVNASESWNVIGLLYSCRREIMRDA